MLSTDNPLGDQQLGFPILGGRTRALPDPPIYVGRLRPPTPPLNVGLRPPQLLVIGPGDLLTITKMLQEIQETYGIILEKYYFCQSGPHKISKKN